MLVIDAANVIGARPTGWWRDRLGATPRFTKRVRATMTAGRRGGCARAREGDDTIAAVAEAHGEVIVATADRQLAERVRAANAKVVRPSWLFDELVD